MRLYKQFGHPVPVHNHPLSKMFALHQVAAWENHFLSFHSAPLTCGWIFHLYDHHTLRDSSYTPLSLLFSRVNKLSLLSSSFCIVCLNSLANLVAVQRTPSTSVVGDRPKSGCRIQKWPHKCWCSAGCNRSPQLQGLDTTHYPPASPGPFFACSVARLQGFMELFCSRCKALHLSELNFMRFSLVHSFNFSRPL